MEEAHEEMLGAVAVSARCSRVLERWVSEPRVDRDLARRVLSEVATRVDVFVVLEMEEMLREKKWEVDGEND